MTVLKTLRRWFLTGLLVGAPVGLTIYFIFVALNSVDSILIPLQEAIYTKVGGKPDHIPGLGLLVILGSILIIGAMASSMAMRRLAAIPGRIFERLPLVKLLYNALRDLFEAVVGGKKSFNRPVLVQLLPGSPARLFGFITNDDLSSLGIKDRVAVYMPQSYNFAGNLVLVPPDAVTPLQVESGQVMAFVISGGVSVKQPAQSAALPAPKAQRETP